MAFQDYVANDAIKRYAMDVAKDPMFTRALEKDDRHAIGKDLLDNYMEEIEYVVQESKETKLREVIRGMVKEMLITVSEGDGDSSFFDPDREEAEAAETAAQGQQPYAAGVGIGDESEEDDKQDESFFPSHHDIRREARNRTNEALMQKWGYNKKEK